MISVLFLVAILALISTAVAAYGKCPIWVPVFMLCLVDLIWFARDLPLK